LIEVGEVILTHSGETKW